MDAGDIWMKWLIGAGIGAVFGIFIGIGKLLSAKGKNSDNELPSEKKADD